MLAQIEKDYFKGADLEKASMLKGDERRTFVLSQVERLLTADQGIMPIGEEYACASSVAHGLQGF